MQMAAEAWEWAVTWRPEMTESQKKKKKKKKRKRRIKVEITAINKEHGEPKQQN